jgi:hypothetical protein
VIARLHELHRPAPGTAVVAVLDADDRPVASASFSTDTPGATDGWECRNIILAHLRMIVPDDLRRAAPVRTTVLLICRDGERGWEPDDGRWMWGLRDACALHGLRCGAVAVLAEDGWQIVADGRTGRTPVPWRTPTPAPASAGPAKRPPRRTKPSRVAAPVELPTPPTVVDHPAIAAAAFTRADPTEAPASPPRPIAVRYLADLPDIAASALALS